MARLTQIRQHSIWFPTCEETLFRRNPNYLQSVFAGTINAIWQLPLMLLNGVLAPLLAGILAAVFGLLRCALYIAIMTVQGLLGRVSGIQYRAVTTDLKE
jgi:hypothetical protein